MWKSCPFTEQYQCILKTVVKLLSLQQGYLSLPDCTMQSGLCTVGQCVCYHLNACLMIKETPLLYIMLTLSSRQKGHKTSIQVHV